MNAEERHADDALHASLLATSDALLDAASEVTPAPERLLAARSALVARAARSSRSSRGSLRSSWWIPVAAAIVTVAIGLFMIRGARPITYSVDGAGAMTSGFIRSAADRETTVAFTDGSSIILSAGTTGRVNEVSARGARFAVEQGHVAVHVAKRDGGADYVIEAGPYRVKVTGTRFSVDWDPSRQHMLVSVTEGSVVVTGPTAEDGITVGVGDALDLGLRETVSDARAAPSAQERRGPPQPAVSADPALPSPSALAVAPSSAEASKDEVPKVSWSARIAKGDFATVLSEADARGIDATLTAAPLDDLMALADAARYGGRGGVATQVLEAVRRRFPGSQPASTAAFLLARAAEDAGNAGRAIALYDATMSEGGAFAAEALGRKMALLARTAGKAAALPVAKEYLRSYPKGPYAGAAQAIVDGG